MKAKEWLSGLRGGRHRPAARRIATVADGLAGGRDNFLLLRLLAASLVIYGHAPAITGGRGWPDVFVRLGWGSYSGDLAVDVFFVVSGFMIAGSSSSSIVGTSEGMVRNTAAVPVRVVNALTRKRAFSPSAIAKSSSRSRSNSARWSSLITA